MSTKAFAAEATVAKAFMTEVLGLTLTTEGVNRRSWSRMLPVPSTRVPKMNGDEGGRPQLASHG